MRSIFKEKVSQSNAVTRIKRDEIFIHFLIAIF